MFLPGSQSVLKSTPAASAVDPVTEIHRCFCGRRICSVSQSQVIAYLLAAANRSVRHWIVDCWCFHAFAETLLKGISTIGTCFDDIQAVLQLQRAQSLLDYSAFVTSFVTVELQGLR